MRLSRTPKINSAWSIFICSIQCPFIMVYYDTENRKCKNSMYFCWDLLFKVILFKNKFNYWCINVLKYFYCIFSGIYHFYVYGNRFNIIEIKLFISINSIHDMLPFRHSKVIIIYITVLVSQKRNYLNCLSNLLCVYIQVSRANRYKKNDVNRQGKYKDAYYCKIMNIYLAVIPSIAWNLVNYISI